MDFFDFFNISERFLELINPFSADKILCIGEVMGFNERTRLIDFGCGYAEPLVLWAEKFGISGLGVDVREQACRRAQEKVTSRGLDKRLEIVCADGAKYEFKERSFDAATCIGASFIWNGYRPALQAMSKAIAPGRRLAIGEVFWRNDQIPANCSQVEAPTHTEFQLLEIAREEGFDFEYVVRSSQDDWDRYEAGNWRGLLYWLDENPDHPERQEVVDYLHKIQNEYLTFGRKQMGWAVFVLRQCR